MSNKLVEYFSPLTDASSLARFIMEGCDIRYVEHYLEEGVDVKDISVHDSYYDRNDNYKQFLIVKFQDEFFKLTLRFNSYEATFDTEYTEWEDFTLVKPVTKTVTEYDAL